MNKQKPYDTQQEGLARNINRGRAGVHIVFFPSVKNSRVIVCESKLEADFCLFLEYDTNVVSYTPQPMTVSVWVDNKIKEYTPDFQVRYKFKSDMFYEVKPELVKSWDEYMILMRHVADHFKKINHEFIMKTEADIRIEPFFGNLKFLYSKIHRVQDTEMAYMLEIMRQFAGEVLYEELLDIKGAPSIGAIAKAIFERKIVTNMTKLFDHETILRLAK